MVYWQSRQVKETSQEVGAAEIGERDQWQSYISQLRKSLDGRKWVVVLMADAINRTPHEAVRYTYIHTLCQNVIYLQHDISQFWDEGWELGVQGGKSQEDKDQELEELPESTIAVIPEALSLMEHIIKPTPYNWATTNTFGYQIMYRRVPFSLARWFLG
ncbi:hypothetical protein N431DRAFT_455854 [Stipitochalara longipes BDJ]|nr:hypothetical protein N431DRAFT_455854 [Stipitochalara longipes BDJ]